MSIKTNSLDYVIDKQKIDIDDHAPHPLSPCANIISPHFCDFLESLAALRRILTRMYSLLPPADAQKRRR